MPYNIFLSHSEIDTPIAKAVAKIINDVFAGDIFIYLALENVVGGAAWKNELKENLDRCDAIITIFTQESLFKPWIYVEWSPFWLKNKIYYTLITNDISNADLIQPMIDRQVINLNKTEDVRLFFKALSKDSKTENSSFWRHVDDFVIAVENGLNEKLDTKYGIFRRIEKELPEGDFEKRKISEFFYKKNDYINFLRVVQRIRDDWTKVDIILNLFKDSKISHTDELTLSLEIAKTINRGSYIGDVVKEIISLGDLETKVVFDLVDMVSKRNQDELRYIAEYLVEHDHENSDLFKHVIESTRSNVHLRNVAKHAIGLSKHEGELLNYLIGLFNNSAELKNVALELIDTNHYHSSCMDKVVDKIISRGNFTNYLKSVLTHLAVKDRGYAIQYFKRKSEEFIILKDSEIQF